MGELIGGALTGALISGIGSSLFRGASWGGKGDLFGLAVASISQATPPKTTVMPVPDDKAAQLAERKALALRRAQYTGRQSSILSQGGGATDLLGG